LPLTAVFDTNILFSATGWRGNPFQCIERARAGGLRVLTCPELMEFVATDSAFLSVGSFFVTMNLRPRFGRFSASE